ncbi:MAG: transporter substrate-binding domain-containing protein [Treponema sp.]|jgi:L-cystine transport system substrate-binding protein|nr:transporter substrate-binding domain-containing protein [Treponema sp.]
MKNNVLKTAVAVLAVFILASATISCKKNEQTIVIGTGQAYEPFCYKDADGNLAGYDVEVVREINKRLPEYTFKFEIFEFKNVLVSLATGKIDVGAHEFEENPERRETYLYGEEGYNDYDSFVAVKADGPWANISGIEDLAGDKDAILAVSTGSNYEAYAKTWNETHGPDKQLTYVSYDDDYVRDTNVINGTNAARLGTLFDIEFANAKRPGYNLKAVGSTPIIESKAYFLFKKGDVTLQQAFDKALREIKADGALDKIKERVFSAYFKSL